MLLFVDEKGLGVFAPAPLEDIDDADRPTVRLDNWCVRAAATGHADVVRRLERLVVHLEEAVRLGACP